MNRKGPKRFVAKIEANQPWLDFVKRVPNISGCYSLWRGDLLLYIGSSLLMYQRLNFHNLRDIFVSHQPDRIKIWPVECHGLTTSAAKIRLNNQRARFDQIATPATE